LYIKSLKLNNYRNYDRLEIEFAMDFNIIYGDNAQGKTNILEALFLCASGRSHRTSKDAELIEMGKEQYAVMLKLVKQNEELAIEIFYKRDEKKRIRINEIPLRKIGNLIGNLNAVMFSPEDLLMIKEGPSERRRFLDITISQLKPTYFFDLQQYARLLAQRNNLLREINEKRHLIGTLEVWNENLVKTGARLIKVRSEFVKRLNEYAQKNHRKITNDMEELKIEYSPSVNAESYENLEDIERSFMKKLERSLSSELARCTTLYGPQRDDYEIYLNTMNIKQFGSQGQQRTAVLSLKLSEIDIMKQETDENPVLLLDDVLSELDSKRQEYLFKNLEGVQTFITSTDKSFFNESVKGGLKFFNVRKGKVIEE